MADTLRTIKCPACQHVMTKVFVPSQGINVDICLDGCGGIYFDNREFKYLDEQHESIDEITEAIKGKEFIKVNENLPRTCPACGARMVKNFASAKKEVQIDECYSCGGKFLDHGELEKIRAQYATEEERSADVMKQLYDTVGLEIKAVEARHAKIRRSPLQRMFNALINGD